MLNKIVLKKENIKEFVENEDTAIILGDCLEILREIKDESIDLIFADPPYNIGKNFGNNIDTCKYRISNKNGQIRIFGGKLLRDYFKNNFNRLDKIEVAIIVK